MAYFLIFIFYKSLLNALLMLMLIVNVITMQTFHFKTSILAIQLFLIMILNMYSTPEWSQTK